MTAAPIDFEKARGILLVGPAGAGKSAVAAKIIHAAKLIGRRTGTGARRWRAGAVPHRHQSPGTADRDGSRRLQSAQRPRGIGLQRPGRNRRRANHRRDFGAERCRGCQRHRLGLPLPPRHRHQYGPHPPAGRGAGRHHRRRASGPCHPWPRARRGAGNAGARRAGVIAAWISTPTRRTTLSAFLPPPPPPLGWLSMAKGPGPYPTRSSRPPQMAKSRAKISNPGRAPPDRYSARNRARSPRRPWTARTAASRHGFV